MLDSAYLVLLFLIAFIEIVRKKINKFDFLTLFNIYFSLMYPLPAFLLAVDFENSASDVGLGISLYTNNIQTALAIFTGYFIVLIGFYSNSAYRWGNNIIIKARGNHSTVIIYAIILLLLSCLSIYIYGLQYGGFLNALANTALIRVQAVEGGPLVFFKHFTLFSIFASYLLGSFVFIKKMKEGRVFLYIVFVFSTFVALTAITLTGGRAYLINYLLVFYLVYILKNRKISWIFATLFVCLAALMLFYIRILFFSLTALSDGYSAVINTFLDSITSNSANDFNFYNFIQNFQFPIYSLDVAFSKNYELRWFVDLIYGFTSLIPDRFLGTEQPESIMYYNTLYIIGNRDFAIPTGFLAFGVYSLWWPGLIVVCFLYGWIGRYLQTILNKHIHEVFWMPFIYVVIAQMWMDFVPSDPETFLQGYFSFLIAIFFLFAIASKFFIILPRKI